VKCRSLRGQTIGLIVHNHLRSRIHLCWSTETGTFKYRDCIERSFFREKDWLRFCKALQISSVFGLAACLVRVITYDDDHRTQRCIYLETAVWGNRTAWKRYCQNCLKSSNICFCPVIPSSIVS